MQHITNQLKAVRRSGRVLLVVRRLAQLLMVLAPLAVLLGLLDYALRLPGPMRLVIGLAVLGCAGVWLATRLNRAWRFWPSLAELALRAERLYPQLAGSLASAMEFSMQAGEYASPGSTAAMAKTAIAEMEDKSKGIDVKKMLNIVPTLRTCALAVIAGALLAAVCSAAPEASATAARRWLMPLGDTQWPKVNQVEALTSDGAVFVADSKVRLRAQVTQGWTDGMLMTIQYRVLDESGEGTWESVRVAEQRGESSADGHVYETMLDVPPAVARSLISGQRQTATLEVRYIAGDDTTDTQSLTLAARPEISSVVVTAAPPRYALSVLGEQRTPLHEQPDRIASTSAYLGSRVALDVRFNKPIPREQAADAADNWRAQLGDDAAFELNSTDDLASGFTLTWVLRETVTGSFALTDGFGLTSTDNEKQYRIQAIKDEPPTVVLLRPAIDESVLPAATVELYGLAEDDVAMRSLQLEIVVPDRENTPEDAEQIATRVLQRGDLIVTGTQESLELGYTLDFSGLGLLPGDVVLVTAVGTDIYDLPGFDSNRPAQVRSDTRRLTVITEQQLADQIRRTLRGVRNTAQSLEREQRIVAGRTEDGQPAETAEQQAQIGRRIAAQQDTIDAVRERLERNDPQGLEGLQDLLARSEEMLDAAQAASERAEAALSEAATSQQDAHSARQGERAASEAGEAAEAQQRGDQAEKAEEARAASEARAGAAQEEAREQLAELIAALDMGESVGEIESQLSRIRAEAERVASETRQLLPRTIGQQPEDLSEELRDALDSNAEDQRELAEDIEELIDTMRATAEQIGENGETPEQRATARTLSEAADTANRQGLQENTEQAAQELGENQISDAATRQQEAMNTLDEMLEELGQQQQRRQEELTRLLQEMAQKIESLVNEQREQLGRAEETAADGMGVLEQPQYTLRRRTMAVEAQAMQSSETTEVGEALGEAVRDQAEAITAIRLSDKQSAIAAQTQALAKLEEALALLREQQQEQQQEQQRAERFALRQAYYDLAEQQEDLRGILSQHERDEDYGRRDWRQINELYEDRLDERTFDEEQLVIRERATELSQEAGEAMVYQSIHRRIDGAAARAEERLSGRTIDGAVLDDQALVAQMLRAMGDALDDSAGQDKFESDDDDGGDDGGGEGGGGPPGEEPLVPELAQIKLLREVMMTLRAQTARLDEAAATMTPEERQQAQEELAELQIELRDLGEQLVEQLRQRMQPPEQEPRN